MPPFMIILVNMHKCNAVTHTLLNFASHAHLILLQEPWFNKIGTVRHNNTHKGIDILGSVTAPTWDPIYPTLKPDQQPKVMAYACKRDATTNEAPPFSIIPHPDLCAHPCLQVLDITHIGKLWHIINFYHNV